MIDPFDSAPPAPDFVPEELVQEVAAQDAAAPAPFDAPAPAAPAPTPAPRPAPSAGAGEIVVTLKGGNTMDAPWIVVHAGSVAEADAMLGADLAAFMAKVQKAAAHFKGQAPAGTAPAAAPAAQAATPAYQQAPGGDVRSCKHGQMTYKTGISKAGKPWQAHMCPAPKGAPDQCPPEWIR